MRPPIFFYRDYNLENGYKFTDEFVFFLLSKILSTHKDVDIRNLFKLLEKEYGFDLKFSHFKCYISKFVDCKSDSIQIDERFLIAYSKLAIIDELMEKKDELSEEELNNLLLTSIKNNRFYYRYSAPLLFSMDKKIRRLPQEYYLSEYFNFLAYDSIYELKNSVDMICDTFLDLPIDLIIKNETILNLLFVSGINSAGDLKEMSTDQAISFLSMDQKNIISSLKKLRKWDVDTFKCDLQNIISKLDTKAREILLYRNGIAGEKKTLQDIANKYSLTRERCRQIESKALKIISEQISNFETSIYAFFHAEVFYRINYSPYETVGELLNDDYTALILKIIVSNNDMIIKYDSELDIFYDSSTVSLSEIVEEINSKYHDVIDVADFELIENFHQKIIKNTHRLFRNSLYLRKGVAQKDLIKKIIDVKFPNGYRVGNESDYLIVKTEYLKEYQIVENFPSMRALVGLIERMDYCLVNKGTYKSIQLCSTIPEELFDRMIGYISENFPTVYYSSVFHEFGKELRESGIDNYFYLKGLIDPLLPKEFKTKRNYILTSNETITAYETILLYMKSKEHLFSITDLRNKFPGVKDYTFYNALYNEIDNNLIFLSDNRFIYLNNINISCENIELLNKFIEDAFQSLDSAHLSSKKLYTRLSIVNKSLLINLKVAFDSFSLFSIIRALNKNKYGFNRPIISKNIGDESVNSYSLVTTFASKLNSFNLNIINNYIGKMNIRGLYSYLSFMEDMSDNYVQVSMDTMYRKDVFQFSPETLEKIKVLLDLLILKFEKIDTSEFKGYHMFPKCFFPWNKYLMVGIVRTFFQNEYQVENTEKFYNLTDFIIKKIHNNKIT